MQSNYILLGFIAALTLAGCVEKTIVVPELQVGDRKVLVEELTGVKCQNCPNGAEQLRILGETLGEHLIVVSLHAAAGYDAPYGNSKYDFRSEDCRAVADYLYVNGDPGAPAASIDRQPSTLKVDDSTSYAVTFINLPWSGIVNSRAAIEPQLGLFISKTYSENERSLEISVNVSPDIPQTGEVHLSIFITEDSIVDVQNKLAQIIPDYIHRHVFRDAVTAPTGDDISAMLSAGLPFTRTYSITLPAAWEAKHCKIVAFVHKHGTPEHKQVLQADEVSVTK